MSRTLVILAALLTTCVTCIVLKENYPFSDFPMYSDPGPARFYFWLATPDSKPLPVQALTGKTSAQLGKIIRSRGDARAKSLKLKHRDLLPIDERNALSADVVRFLRQEAASLKQSLPPKVSIMRTDLDTGSGAIAEKTQIWFTE